jgi:DNA repair protein RadC/antirestriction protein ArdC
MNQAEETRYIAAYARIIGVQEAVAIEYAERKGLAALVDNAYQLLETPEQRQKHQAFLELYRMSSALTRQNPILSSPQAAAGYMHSVMEKVHDKESMVVAFLNTKNRVIDYEQVSMGTINSSLIHPREIFRNAILNKAVSVLLCHNHPSGELTPSAEDLAATKALKEAGEMLGIPVVDHIIITGLNHQEVYSFRAQGVLENHAHYAIDPIIAEKKSAYKEKDKTLEEITAKLEQGIKEIFTSGRYAEYLKVMSRFHRYSLNNMVLIALQNPEASLVAGYHAWQKKFERHVCKGEQAIRIIAPVPEKRMVEREKLDPKTQKTVLGKNGKPLMEEEEITVPRFKVVPVFDVSQTEGKELPSLSKELQGSVQAYDLLFRAIKEASPVPIEIEAMKATKDGYYHLKDKRIALRKGMSETQNLAAVVHEIAHAKLHDRNPQGLDGKDSAIPKDPRTQEVEAESIAYVVCQYYGIETGENSFGYVAGWSSDKELSDLKASLKTIRDTASELIESIDEKLQDLQKTREKAVRTSRKEATEVLAEQIVALAEEVEPYTVTGNNVPVPDRMANIKANIDSQESNLNTWLDSVVNESSLPYSAEATYLLNSLTEVQKSEALFQLENGEYLSITREGSDLRYQFMDAFMTPTEEGFVSQPDLMLDAAKDLTLSERGRSGITATPTSQEQLRDLQKLVNSEPQVTFSRSEHEEIPGRMSMPLSQANRLMERLDQRQSIDREKTDYAGPLTYNTDFRVDYIKEGIPGHYSGRQEIGAGEGTLSHHMQAHVQNYLADQSWQNYLRSKGETEMAADQAGLQSVRDELLPYFHSHSSLTYLEERTNNYMANIQSVAEDKREALQSYYGDVAAYVQLSRQHMNLSLDSNLPEFPQLEQYLQGKVSERDVDHDGSPEKVDIDDQDSRVQLIHHYDKKDGSEPKTSIRERLRSAKSEVQLNQNGKLNSKELEVR